MFTIRYFLSIATIGSIFAPLLIAPIAHASQLGDDRGSLISQILPGANYSTTTIITPGIVTESSSTVIINGNTFGSTGVTEFNYPFNRQRSYNYRHRRSNVIFPQQNIIYPRAYQSNCTTTIIGSPIPSPVPIDRYTGQFCR